MAQLIIDKQYVDFFDDEHIVLTSSIKKVEDLEGVFTEYTKEFTIPATQNNIRIFNHYDIIGLELPPHANPHKAISAFLVLAEGEEQDGRVEMRGVTYKEGKSYSFLIVFYGRLLSIKSRLEKKLLNVCGDGGIGWYSQFGVRYNYDTIMEGWSAKNPDVFMPIVDHTQNYQYIEDEKTDSNGEFKRNNIAPHSGTPSIPDIWGGIKWDNLLPAYNLKSITAHILERCLVNPGLGVVDVTWHHKISKCLENAYIMPNVGTSFPVEYSSWAVGFKAGLEEDIEVTLDWSEIPLPVEFYDWNNNYEPMTGIFTASDAGMYEFTVYIYATTDAILRKNIAVHILRRDPLNVLLDSKEVVIGSTPIGPTSLKREFKATHTIAIWLDAGDTATIEWERRNAPATWVALAKIFQWSLINGPVGIGGGERYLPCNFMPEINAYEYITGFLKTFNLILVSDKNYDIKIYDIQSYYDEGAEFERTGSYGATLDNFVFDAKYGNITDEFITGKNIILKNIDSVTFSTTVTSSSFTGGNTILLLSSLAPSNDFTIIITRTSKDFTQYVDITDVSTRKLDIPKNVIFKFAENPTTVNKEYNSHHALDYGEKRLVSGTDFNNDVQSNESIFSIYPPSAIPRFDSNLNWAGSTNIQIPKQLDEIDGSPVKVDFILFFNSGLMSSDPFRFQTGLDNYHNPLFEDHYQLPLIENFFFNPDDLPNTLRNITYTPVNIYPPMDYVAVRNTFSKLFEDWYDWMFDRNTRKVVFKGTVPMYEYADLKLNDRIHINGGLYIISELKYDLLDNSIQMSLLTYDDYYTTIKTIDIQPDGKSVVAICKNDICREDVGSIPSNFLQSNSMTINEYGDIIWFGKVNSLIPYNSTISSSGGGGEGYHKYVVDIPVPVTPIEVGDVMSFYTTKWRKADSSREDRTAQGAVVKIEGTKYTLIRFGDIKIKTHGYELNTWYWLAADGTYVKERPFKLAQLLFYVYDADILQFNIEQPITQIEEKLGWIHLGEHPDIGWTFTPSTINVFEELKIGIPHYDPNNTRSFTLDTPSNRVKLNFPVRPEEPVFVQVTIMVALTLESSSTRNIEIAHGVDGTVMSQTDWYNQQYGANLPALGVYIPITYHWSGQVKNDHTISIFIRSDTAEQIMGVAKSIQVTGQI